jgi:hypothetical protein
VFVFLIAVLVLAFPPTYLVAQQGTLIPVTVKVTDQSGAVVPGAVVRIDSRWNSPNSVKTDSQGEVVLNLTPGVHSFLISESGFSNWKKQIDVRDISGQIVEATIEVAGNDDPIAIADMSRMPQPEPQPSMTYLIPPQPLGSLPLVGVKFHRRRHIRWF